MVKSHHRRDRSSSEDSDEHSHKKKHKKHHRTERSTSPEESSHHRRHHQHKHKHTSPTLRHRIKPDPDADSNGEEKYSRHIKQEQYPDRSRGGRARGHREHRHHDRVHIKQEPEDEDTTNIRRQNEERHHNDNRRRETRNRRENLTEDQRYGRREHNEEAESEPAQPKDAPNFELSGKLTEDTNTYKGVVIKYNEPPEARKAKKHWRLYPFKNDEALKPFHMHRQSAYLFGRDRLIADIPVDHPSCSKQHAVYQYRMVPYETADGRKANKVAPYIIDLESANGTYVNNQKIDTQRYVELMEKDVIKFGYSSREYVLLHDKSNTDELEEDEED